MDIEFCLKEFYDATFSEDESGFSLTFINNQTFRISVEEEK